MVSKREVKEETLLEDSQKTTKRFPEQHQSQRTMSFVAAITKCTWIVETILKFDVNMNAK
jgi:hypothetical protein